ncbi:MAG: glycosyltransferase [Planctomycetes bacterium RIFCSPLOWO2_12_38_17]|nr:MAG: glycosyltransferase [Planctomycetes bacterium RIFCSPLOWO2_12_38_17]
MDNVGSVMYSIVVPVYNEENVIKEFYNRTTAVLSSLKERYEIIFINDGSVDNSLTILRELHAEDSSVKVINFSRNFGHQMAITAGMDYSAGNAVIIMDSDLQDPPEVIAKLVERWKEGHDVVYAVREARKGETLFKRLTATLFYRLIVKITNVSMHADVGDFRLMDKKVIDIFRTVRERHRFIRGLVFWVGFKQTGISYIRNERFAGETKYPFRKMLKFAIDGITSFSFLPLQLAMYAGAIISLMSFASGIYILCLRIITGRFIPGIAGILVSVLFLGGIQLLFLGLIGEYIGRMYDEIKQRPLYIVQEFLGFNQKNNNEISC